MTQQELADTLKEERRILDSVARATGMRFEKLAGIDTTKKEIAEKVLPSLAMTTEKMSALPNIRAGVFALFISPYANPFLTFLLANWETESDKIARYLASQALAKAVDASSCKRVWQRVRDLGRTSELILVARLATFPELSDVVVPILVSEMNDSSRTIPELTAAGEVTDFRVREWFKEQVFSPYPNVRRLAQRIVNRKRSLPLGLEYIDSEPDRSRELFSKEIDISDLDSTLADLAKQIREVSPTQRLSVAVRNADLDKWIAVKNAKNWHTDSRIFIRLEDIDTIELVIIGDSKPSGREKGQ